MKDKTPWPSMTIVISTEAQRSGEILLEPSLPKANHLLLSHFRHLAIPRQLGLFEAESRLSRAFTKGLLADLLDIQADVTDTLVSLKRRDRHVLEAP